MAVPGSIVARRGGQRMPLFVTVVLGGVGWTGLVALAASMLSADPPRAGFDLALVLEAGRRVAQGGSPYDPVLLAETRIPSAVDLFFAYPPVVAQAAALAAAVPLGAALAGLWVAAVATLGFGLHRLVAAAGLANPTAAEGLALAVLPFVAPFAVALLFGNLDAFFPAAFAALLWWAVSPSRSAALAAGVAIGLATVAKLSPGVVLFWLAMRALRIRRLEGPAHPRAPLAVALATIAMALLLSYVVGGIGPWQEYLGVAQAVSGAALVDPRNIGPASQLALWLKAGEEAARAMHLGVVALAGITAALAAWRVDNPEASLFVAALASLVLLPLTWFHYPAVLLPFATSRLIGQAGKGVRAWAWAPIALVVALLALAWPVLLWLSVALVGVGVLAGRRLVPS